MKKTPFYEEHIKAGARIVEFAGYLMPIQYKTGILEEHRKVREEVGMFDVSHMGEIEVWGKDAREFVDRITTNNVMKLSLNQVQYTTLCYENGGIVDDLLVYCFDEHFLLVVNASNIEKDYEWILENAKKFNVSVKNMSDDVAELAIQGPKAEMVIKEIIDFEPSQISYYWFKETEISGVNTILSRTGYTGEDGFEIYFDKTYAEKIWNEVLYSGKKEGLSPVGLGARDSLRLEMGYCLYGNDITKDTTPLEAGLGWVVKLDKEFIGCDVLRKQKVDGLKKKLIGFELEGRVFPRQHYKIFGGSEEIGEVTSGIFSPCLQKGIGMGYVDINFSAIGTEIEVQIREKKEKGKIVKKPFYKNGTVKKH